MTIKSLSDRLDQLKTELIMGANLSPTKVEGIMRLVTFMNKEFIKGLKEGLSNNDKLCNEAVIDIFDDINKLAGANLI